jgi:potassium voltage-gated channel Shaw-related subfamily C protein
VCFRDTQDVLVGLDRLDLDAEPITEEEIPHKFDWDFDPTIRHKNMSVQEYMKTLPWFKRIQPRVWQLFEEPYSSSAAKVSSVFFLYFESFINHYPTRQFKLFQSFLSLFPLSHSV